MVSASTLIKLDEIKAIADQIKADEIKEDEGYKMIEKIIYSIGE